MDVKDDFGRARGGEQRVHGAWRTDAERVEALLHVRPPVDAHDEHGLARRRNVGETRLGGKAPERLLGVVGV